MKTDSECQEIVLQKFYEFRKRGPFQWAELSEEGHDFSWADDIDLPRISLQLADGGLLNWKPVRDQRGRVCGGHGEISALGIKTVEGKSTTRQPEKSRQSRGNQSPVPNEFQSLLSILAKSARMVPVTRLAFGVVGLAAALATVIGIVKDKRVALLGLLLVVVFMTVLLVLGWLKQAGPNTPDRIKLLDVFLKGVLLAFFAMVFLMLSTFAVGWPEHATAIIYGSSDRNTKQGVSDIRSMAMDVAKFVSDAQGLVDKVKMEKLVKGTGKDKTRDSESMYGKPAAFFEKELLTGDWLPYLEELHRRVDSLSNPKRADVPIDKREPDDGQKVRPSPDAQRLGLSPTGAVAPAPAPGENRVTLKEFGGFDIGVTRGPVEVDKSTRVKSVTFFSGDRINGIMLRGAVGEPAIFKGSKEGMKQAPVELSDGEHLIGFRGLASNGRDILGFPMRGGWFRVQAVIEGASGRRYSQAFGTGGPPNISLDEPAKVTVGMKNFEILAPEGHEVVGLHGKAGDVLDYVGLITQKR